MLRKQKKPCTVLLAVLLALTMLPPVAFAEDEPDGATLDAAQGGPAPAQADAVDGAAPEAAGDALAQEAAAPEEAELPGDEPTVAPDEATPGQDSEEAPLGDEGVTPDLLPLTTLADTPEPTPEEGGSLTPLATVTIDDTNFPDATFCAYVEGNLDTNKDGTLSDVEIAAVGRIDVSWREITTLQGIEHFTALTALYCSWNELTSLDVSKNVALTELSCYNNQLTILDVSKNVALTTLYCDSNRLTSLDVSKNTALEDLYCENNQLTTLDVSKATALGYFRCDSNQLTTLDVSKNDALYYLNCADNQLTSLNVSKNTALENLYCEGNRLTSLDVSKNTALEDLYCEDNRLTALDLSGLDSLQDFRGSEQHFALTLQNDGLEGFFVTISLSNPAFDNTVISYADGKLTSTSSSVRTTTFTTQVGKGEYALSGALGLSYEGQEPLDDVLINSENFPDDAFRAYVERNFDNNPRDRILSDVEIVAVTGIDISEEYSYSITSLKGIEYFIVLTYLDCSQKRLTALDISANTALTYLDCSSSRLTALDVSKNTALEYLYCYGNQLTAVDLSTLDLLRDFDGEWQTPELTLTGTLAAGFSVVIDLSSPMFGSSLVSYASGKLTSTNISVQTTTFTTQTGKEGYTLSGTLNLSYEGEELGSISGIITDSEGVGYGMMYPTARLYKAYSSPGGASQYWSRIRYVTASEVDGSYRFGGLEPGVYLVSANHSQETAESYYSTDGSVYFQDEATPITVVAGQDLLNIDIRVQRAGIIQGTVTPNEAYYDNGITASIRAIPWDVETDTRIEDRSTYEAGSGYDLGYRISCIPPGTYKLQFSPYSYSNNPYASGYYVDDASPLVKSAADGTVITVAVDDVLTKNIITTQAYRIIGTAPAPVNLGNGVTARIDAENIYYYEYENPDGSSYVEFSVYAALEGTAQQAGVFYLKLDGQSEESIYRAIPGAVDTDLHLATVPPTSTEGATVVLDLSQLSISGRFEPGVELAVDNSGQQAVNGITHALHLSGSGFFEGRAAYIPGEALSLSARGESGSATQTGRYTYRLMVGDTVIATDYAVVEAGDSPYQAYAYFNDAGFVAPSEDTTYRLDVDFEPVAFGVANGSTTFDIGNGVTLGFAPEFGVDGDGNIVVSLYAELSGTAASDALHHLSFTYDDDGEVTAITGLSAIAVQQGEAVVNRFYYDSYTLTVTLDPSGSNVLDLGKLGVGYTLDTDVSKVVIHNSCNLVNGLDIHFSRGLAASGNGYDEMSRISGYSIANDAVEINPDFEDVMLVRNGTALYLAAYAAGTAEATGAIDYNLSVGGLPLAGGSQRLLVAAGESEWGEVGFYAPDTATWYSGQKHIGTPFSVVIEGDTEIDLDATFTPGVIRTVSFDAQGGSPVAPRQIPDGAVVGELPVSERDGYRLVGWFTAAIGGSQVSAATEVGGDVTYYAHWEEATTPPPPLSDTKDITSFTLEGVTGTIDGTTVSVTLPYGTDVTSLAPVIDHTGTAISPAGAQDFTSSVTYTVTAEDGTTKDYTVTVTVAPPSTSKDITSFTLAGAAGAIDGTAVSVELPYGADVTSLAPVIDHTGTGISPAGAQDFSSSVTYTVTAEDGTTKDYTVTVTVTPPSDAKDITSFTLEGVAGTIDGTAIAITVPYGTDVTSLTPVIDHTGTGISPEGAQDFSSPVTYTVTAEDGTTKAYTVTATVSTEVPVITAPATWEGEGAATVRLDAAVGDFVRLLLDGVEVDSADYTVSEGSTVITLHEDYLATLAVGDHVLTAIFTDGQALIPLRIGERASGDATVPPTAVGGDSLPATGDASSLALMAAAALMAATGATGTCALLAGRARRRREGEQA